MVELTVTLHEKPPVEDVVAPQVEIEAPLLIVTEIVTDGVNPVPVTVVEAPLGP